MGVLYQKSSFKMQGRHSLLNCIGALTLSLLLKLLIRSMLYKSTIPPYVECCCHVWAGAPSCYLELLGKLQKQICRTVGPSLAASLEPLAHRRNVASVSLSMVIW